MGGERPEAGDWKALGALLRQRRTELGMSRAQAAKAAGISDTLWRHFEMGQRQIAANLTVPPNPRPETLAKIARALDLPVSALYGAIGWPLPSASNGEAEPPDEVRDLVARVRRLDPAARALVDGVIDELLKRSR